MDWAAVYRNVYSTRVARSATFRKAVLSGGKATYPTDRVLSVGVDYRAAGFDFVQRVQFPEDRVLVQVWLRDWFSRSVDGATDAELIQMVADLRGQVVAGDAELWSRWLVDGRTLKYQSHILEQRPDGVIFAATVTLAAA